MREESVDACAVRLPAAVVVEVDEDAHLHYCQKSDIARVNDIYAAYVTGEALCDHGVNRPTCIFRAPGCVHGFLLHKTHHSRGQCEYGEECFV